MYNCTIFDAFTGISPFEKLGVIKFLESTSDHSKEVIQQSVDYAVKDCPSFGGYIFSVNFEKEPIAVAVINKSGIPGFQSKNILVQFNIEESWQTIEFTKYFFGKLIALTNKDLSLQLNADNPNIPLLQEIGFVPKALEFRYSAAAAGKAIEAIPSTPIPASSSKKKGKKKKSKLRVAV